MEYFIKDGAGSSLLKVRLDKDESFFAEPGSMVFMKDLEIVSGTSNGVFGSLKRKLFGKEDFFINKFESREESGGEVWISPRFLGAIKDIFIDKEAIFAKAGSFLGIYSEEGKFSLTGEPGNTITVFGMRDFTFLKMKGRGVLFLTGLGGIEEFNVENDVVFVDTGHLLAYTESLEVSIVPVGGVKSFVFSGEGVVCKIVGSGTVWVQTRNEFDFADSISHLISEYSNLKN